MTTLTEKIEAKTEEKIIRIPQKKDYKIEAKSESFGRDYLTSNKAYK